MLGAVSGTVQGKLLLWDSKRLALLSVVHAHPGARIQKVFVDAVVGLALTAAEDGKLRTWDVTVPELTCVGTFDKHEESISAVAPRLNSSLNSSLIFERSGLQVVDFNKNRVLSGAADGSLYLWHLVACLDSCF